MIEHEQVADAHLSSLPPEEAESPPIIPAPETMDSSVSLSAYSLPSHQKIEISFAQGHRLYLEGSFDWNELRIWLTPLLTLEE